MSRNDTNTEKSDVGGSTLTARQSAVLVALLDGHTQASASRKTGVSTATIKRWVKLDSFRDALRDAQSERIRRTTAILSGFGADAAILLRKAADNPKVAPNVQVRAAIALLREGREYISLTDLEERLADLEALIARREGVE